MDKNKIKKILEEMERNNLIVNSKFNVRNVGLGGIWQMYFKADDGDVVYKSFAYWMVKSAKLDFVRGSHRIVLV